jgi:hypothetical protein
MDLIRNEVYGTSWISLFSPQLETFDLQVEPTALIGPKEDAGQTGNVLDWLGRPDTGYGGFARPRPQLLARGAYEHTPPAAGVRDVPVAGWAAKSFVARWTRALEPSHLPIRARLVPEAEGVLVPTIRNQLGVAIEDAFLIRGGDPTRHTTHKVGTLMPSADARPKPLDPGLPAPRLAEWVPLTAGGSAETAEKAVPGLDALMRRIQFFAEGPKQDRARNDALRSLDQSHRLWTAAQVVLVGRLPHWQGCVRDLDLAHSAATTIRAGGFENAAVSQDTYIRVFLPLPAEERAAASARGKLNPLIASENQETSK